MSKRIKALWQSDPSAYGPRRERRSCHYEAYVPDLLSRLPLDLDSASAADVADAERTLATFGSTSASNHDLEQLARFLLRAEAVASSKIEGLQVNARRLAEQEVRPEGHDSTAQEVLGNVNAMVHAVDEVARAPAVTTADVLEIHGELMRHSSAPHLGGEVRRSQNWIGGNDYNPCDAEFVPPPPEYVEELLDDLCTFINRDDLPGVVQAGIAHAQFETIHPFADGNGRTGRALIQVVLRRRHLATVYVPPISLALATSTDAYINGLASFRYEGEPTSESGRGAVRRWLDVFIAATRRAVTDADELRDRLATLERHWRDTVRARRGSTADRLLRLLIAHPVVRIPDVTDMLNVSRQAATLAVNQLVEARVIRQAGTSGRSRLFEATDVFNVLTDVERAGATLSGDTHAEDPRRAVPHRRTP